MMNPIVYYYDERVHYGREVNTKVCLLMYKTSISLKEASNERFCTVYTLYCFRMI